MDRAGPLSESMMRIQGLKETSDTQIRRGGAPCWSDGGAAPTHCLQTLCLEASVAAASEPKASSASVPSSLQSSCRQNSQTFLVEFRMTSLPVLAHSARL